MAPHSFTALLALAALGRTMESQYTFHALASDALDLSAGPDSSFLGNFTSSRLPFAAPPSARIPTSNHALLATITLANTTWKITEDLATLNGALVFTSPSGTQRIFRKTAEVFAPGAEASYPRYAGVPIRDVGMALNDVLADKLLTGGEPSEAQVRATIPPLTRGPAWTGFVGNVQANDVMAIFPMGNTRAWQVVHMAPEVARYARARSEGFVGGWMPAVRKVFAVREGSWWEVVGFGDVDAPDPFVIQTWHRSMLVENGKVVKVVYGHSYPDFAGVQKGPPPEKFYEALLRFGEYWEGHLKDVAPLTLPDQSWVDMTKFAFAKELMTRPGGVYPKYGAFDRDYAGSEYDGFQDIFTSSLSANLEWGRFTHAAAVLDNYFTLFVSPAGDINMRGPEVGQFGLTLSLLAKYAAYTNDIALLTKHKAKIIATAAVLTRLHDEALALPKSNPGYGLIHGWSESDAALKANPATWWKPYFANSAFAARGFRDLARVPLFAAQAADWKQRADTLVARTVEAMNASVLRNKGTLPYIPPLPGVANTFREAMAKGDSEQAWPHRLYAELVHANVLPRELQGQVINVMRAYGATSMGVVANVGAPSGQTRDILGFISYGYALALLFLDRGDEYVLFLYSHRYHVHSRGAWNAAEVSGTAGGASTFCNPAQLTIPKLVRWALVLEDQDEERVYLGRGVPRAWLATGKEVGIRGAPTRWGRVDYTMKMVPGKEVTARAKFEGRVPAEVEFKLRLPKGVKIGGVLVNGRDVPVKNEAVVVKTEGAREFFVQVRIS
ncbi:hypothetical protein EJ06DRAFT_579650 [Trichodelitschia bisporula]|uniref:Six-hairpin glycosidase n=1 Tax=Trichodelitschia bisporula TaxID=703511 RepID=A0A6G1I5W4_9PEZI|nr:hypothetical protein EJ06DRAFT_579650 [Trichodelitschia bisporula]